MTLTYTEKLPVYELELKDGSVVRFHDFEEEDGAFRVLWKRAKCGFPESVTHSGSRHTPRIEPWFEEYLDAVVPKSELASRCSEPVKVGDITYRREYERRQEKKGLIFTKRVTHYSAVSDTWLEWEPEVFITSGVITT